ncbi:MAG TPA: nuclear transport factor 2 family protein [Pseudomonadales bacterium]
MTNVNDDRRKFIRGAGLAVTAAAAGSSAAASEDGDLRHKLGLLEDGNAIRALQQRLLTALQRQHDPELATLFADPGAVVQVHESQLLDARLDDTRIDVAPDRRSARAELHMRVQLARPFSGNGTLQQMARLQGQTESQWSERGVYTVHYVKAGSEWKIRALDYVAT